MKSKKKKLVCVLLTVVFSLIFLFSCTKSGDKEKLYFCPMHPQVTSDRPGDCPICGMKLVEKKEPEKKEISKKIMYRSTMNPNEISDKPKKDSMGMEMVPFEVGEEGVSTIEGRSQTTLTQEKEKLLNVTYGIIEKKDLKRELRTSAIVVPDEQKLFKINTKIEGWIEKLFVNTSGQFVKKGQPLLKIYSPEYVATQQEFLSTLAMIKNFSKSSNSDYSLKLDDLLEAAKNRLKLWDISEKEIERLQKSNEVEKTVTLYSPADGYVLEKSVLEGQKIMKGETLFTIGDLSLIWAEADIYQSDLPYIKEGMDVTLTLPGWLQKSFKGKIVFIFPYLDAASRTVKVRMEIKNTQMELKPQMYGTAHLLIDHGEKLVIPQNAVMVTGEKTYTFKVEKDNQIVPTEIEVGVRSENYYELIKGLNEGDKVITSANFLIDSESSLKAALESLSKNP